MWCLAFSGTLLSTITNICKKIFKKQIHLKENVQKIKIRRSKSISLPKYLSTSDKCVGVVNQGGGKNV